MEAVAQTYTVIDIFELVAEHVAQALGTDQPRRLAELKKLIAGLRGASKHARDFCNLLVNGVELRLPDSDVATKQRVLGLKPFTKLSTLKVVGVNDEGESDDEEYSRPCAELSVFAGFWYHCATARVLSLSLRRCKLTVGTMALITAGMPLLRDITFEECEPEGSLPMELLAGCNQLHTASIMKVHGTEDEHLDDMAEWAGLACISSLRNLVIEWKYEGDSYAMDCTFLSAMTQLTKLALQLSQAVIVSPHHLSHLTNLEELVLDAWPAYDSDRRCKDFEELAAALSALHNVRKLYIALLNRHCWSAMCNMRLEELVCQHLDTDKWDPPWQVIPTLQKITLAALYEIAAPATAVCGLLSAMPLHTGVVHLENLTAWHEIHSMPDLPQAMQLAEHLQSVMQAMDTGRLTGKRFQPKFSLRGWIPPGSWPPMRHVDEVEISGMDVEEAVGSNWSGAHFAAVFPDVRHLHLSFCHWDVRRFLHGLQDMARLESVWVLDCGGLPDSPDESVKLLREDLMQFKDLSGH